MALALDWGCWIIVVICTVGVMAAGEGTG